MEGFSSFNNQNSKVFLQHLKNKRGYGDYRTGGSESSHENLSETFLSPKSLAVPGFLASLRCYLLAKQLKGELDVTFSTNEGGEFFISGDSSKRVAFFAEFRKVDCSKYEGLVEEYLFSIQEILHSDLRTCPKSYS